MNLLDALKDTGKAEHKSGEVVCIPDHRLDTRRLEIKWERVLDNKWEPKPRTGFFEKIARIGIPGKTVLYSKSGEQREIFCGFTSNGKMITDGLNNSGLGSGIVYYSNEDLHCWYLEDEFEKQEKGKA